MATFLFMLFVYVMLLLAMAFFTLMERKVLGYIQMRKGPNKVGLIGLPQPLADAAKLLMKELSIPSLANSVTFLLSPVMGLFLALIMWILYPSYYSSFFVQFGILFFLCVSSLNVYTTLVAGWSSNSKYSLLGSLRSIAQTISYEVSMTLILLSVLLVFSSFNMIHFVCSKKIFCIIMMMPIFLVWFVTTLAETNRTPFDFAEGESELVSGFNTEYSGGTFALIFMAEYLNILFMSLISAICFFKMSGFHILFPFFMALFASVIAFVFLWVRGSFPRMRYDLLMDLTWKCFLPFSLGSLMILMWINN